MASPSPSTSGADPGPVTPPGAVAIVVVPGLGNSERGEAARAVADLLAVAAPEPCAFAERRLRLYERPYDAASGALREPQFVREDLCDEGRRKRAPPHDAALLEGHVGVRPVDVYELSWADLTRGGKPSALAAVRALLEMAPRSLDLGAAAMADWKSASGESFPRWLGWMDRSARWMVGYVLPTILAGWIAVSSAAIPLHLPHAYHQPVIKAAVSVGGVLLASWFVYRFFTKLREYALLGATLLVFSALAFDVFVDFGVRRWPTIAAQSATCSALGAVPGVGVGAGLACTIASPPQDLLTSAVLIIAWVGAAVGALGAVLKPVVNGGDRWPRSPWLSFAAQVVAAWCALRAWVTNPAWVDPMAVVGVLSAQWALLSLITLGVCAICCLAYQVALRRMPPSLDQRARRAAKTAGNGLTWSFLGLWFCQAFLLTMALEGRLDATWMPLRYYREDYLPFILRNALSFTLPLWVLLTILLIVGPAAWSFAPSLIAEVGDMKDDAPSRFQSTASAGLAEAERLGAWLTRGQRSLAALTGYVGLLPLLILASSLPALDHRVASVVEPIRLRFWAVVLPAGLAALAVLIRSPAALARAWPVIGPILDFDMYLRRPSSPENSARANILARGLTLLSRVADHQTDGAGRYALVILVGHSQGSVIAVDLLHGALGQVRPSPALPPVVLLTLGSPLRQVHAALLPHRFGWVLAPGPGAYLPAIVSRWINLFTAGDYLGRSLWSDAPTTYRGERWTGPSGPPQREERCIGPGAHGGYLHNFEVGCELISQIERAL